MDHASFFSEATLIEIGVYIRDKIDKKLEECFESKMSTWQNKQGSQNSLSVSYTIYAYCSSIELNGTQSKYVYDCHNLKSSMRHACQISWPFLTFSSVT